MNIDTPISNAAFVMEFDQLSASTARERATFLSQISPIEAVCYFIAMTEIDWLQGSRLLKEFINLQNEAISQERPNQATINLAFPSVGGLLWHYYKTAPNQKMGKQFIAGCFSDVFKYHYRLYERFDKNRDGLIHQPSANGEWVVDPLFQSILTWSNQTLIYIGEQLGEDITPLILWNELTIYSSQEALWNKQASCFYPTSEGKMLVSNPPPTINNFLPLFGNIIVQEEAEELLSTMQQLGYSVDESGDFIQKKNFHLDPVNSLFLLLGLQCYDMTEAAECLQDYLSKTIKEKDFGWQGAAVAKILDSPEMIHRISAWA